MQSALTEQKGSNKRLPLVREALDKIDEMSVSQSQSHGFEDLRGYRAPIHQRSRSASPSASETSDASGAAYRNVNLFRTTPIPNEAAGSLSGYASLSIYLSTFFLSIVRCFHLIHQFCSTSFKAVKSQDVSTFSVLWLIYNCLHFSLWSLHTLAEQAWVSLCKTKSLRCIDSSSLHIWIGIGDWGLELGSTAFCMPH